jgi:two-component system, cell cycle response regulator
MRLRMSANRPGSRIAVIDDDLGMVTSLRTLLAREGHEVRTAQTRAEGVELVRTFQPELALLDYHLGPEIGADVVRDVRAFDMLCQVLLVTGYAAEQPARKLLEELDIQGFHDKGDGPDRLMILVDAALKHARALRKLDTQRRQLRHLLAVGPEITRIQPVPDLLVASLHALSTMLRGGDGLIATTNSGLFVLGAADCTVSVHAGIGRFGDVSTVGELPRSASEKIALGLSVEVPTASDGWVVVPLVTRDGDRGCMIVEAAELPDEARDPCCLFARQVTQSLENVTLYERATVDALTRLLRRDVGLQRLDEARRLAARTQTPTSVILIDIDHFKNVNDSYGHAAGDLVLRAVSAAVTRGCRIGDVASRHGGEELLVVLPATDAEGARVVAERIRKQIASETLVVDGHGIRVTASFGVAGAAAEAQASITSADLVHAADKALYRAKGAGRNRVCVAHQQGESHVPRAA